MLTLTRCENENEWNDVVLDGAGHPLQLWGWGEVKSAHGWRAERMIAMRDGQAIGGAQLLIKKLPWPFKALVYIPRGPVCAVADREEVCQELANYAQSMHGAVALTIEPDWVGEWRCAGWGATTNTILIPRTLVLDLHKSEDELLRDMSKKTRQYIRKSESDGVEVRKVTTKDEIGKCLALYKQTAERAGFALHDDDYYYDICDELRDHSVIMGAFAGGELVAFLWLAVSEAVAFELYGGMNDRGQELRANYTLKWQTIRRTKEWGIERYDFNGLLNDGVSKFKQGFASHETMLVGTYSKPLSPLFVVWERGLPWFKHAVRTVRRMVANVKK